MGWEGSPRSGGGGDSSPTPPPQIAARAAQSRSASPNSSSGLSLPRLSPPATAGQPPKLQIFEITDPDSGLKLSRNGNVQKINTHRLLNAHCQRRSGSTYFVTTTSDKSSSVHTQVVHLDHPFARFTHGFHGRFERDDVTAVAGRDDHVLGGHVEEFCELRCRIGGRGCSAVGRGGGRGGGRRSCA